ncbi:DUF2905 domain-containing protein [Sulfurimonas sp. HSL3-7]|uniref:DUF2905 domain-containing protein n=1 Tax=Sulfonitrofixus jiaomeiensis TaxID=3131938 RepID=UPI0031F8D74D
MSLGNLLIAAGLLLLLAGIAYKFGLLGWFGNLPGDIKIESGSTRFYFPVTTMLLVSILLSLLLFIFKK